MAHSFSKSVSSILTFPGLSQIKMLKDVLRKKSFFQEYFEMIYCVLCSCHFKESSVRICTSPLSPAHSNIFAHARHQHIRASLEGCTAMARNMLPFNFAVYHEQHAFEIKGRWQTKQIDQLVKIKELSVNELNSYKILSVTLCSLF